MKRIIVIEDAEMFREKFRDIIELEVGADVTAPTSMAEVRDALANQQFDAILLDGFLWDQQTWEELREEVLRALRPSGLVVGMSTSSVALREMAKVFPRFVPCGKAGCEDRLASLLG